MAAAKPIPEVPEEHKAALHQWSLAAQRAAKAIEEERELRKKVVAAIFPMVKEGSQRASLPAGWTLEMDQKFNRSLDQAALPTAIQEMRDLEITKVVGITTESLFKYTADIVITPMREIEKAVAKEKEPDGPAHRIYAVLAEVLTTKPGLPSLKLVPPKAE